MTHVIIPADLTTGDDRHLPTVHLNGTGRSALMTALEDAREALMEARAALCQTAPNMRDYYVRSDGPTDYRLAQAVFQNRLQTLEALADAVASDAIAIRDAGK